jgi:hypothetical protein
MIQKYEIPERGSLVLPVHIESKMLSVDIQYGKLVLWLDNPYPELSETGVCIRSIYTGEDSSQNSEFIGTAFNQSTGIVSHVYRF